MVSSSMIGRVYRMNWRGWALPVLCLAIGIYETVGLLTGKIEPGSHYGSSRPELGMFGSVGLLIGGAIFTAMTFFTRVTFTDDAIELRGIFESRKLPFSEIRGRHETMADICTFRFYSFRFSNWTLVPKKANLQPINVSNFYKFDDVFYEWLYQLPDLDAEDGS